MNAYPPELATPPLVLVALLGCPELHAGVGEFLRSQQKPPINSLGVADPWAAPRLFGERKSTLTAPADQTGILKANWFAKHRQKRPAVAVLFLERDAVTGNPNDWAVACSALEAVKSAAKGRGARVAIVVVGGAAELPEERAGAIARIGGIDKKALLLLERGPDEAGLRRLGRLLHETAGQAYLDAARRRLSLHAERRIQSPELSARVAFKAAALAEFRADWATAVKTYQNAYAEVARVGLGPPLPLQRAFEVAAVAEHVHVKVVTLLLHQQRLGEALQQFRQHLGLFRRPPFALPPAAAAAHAGWVARQHLAMGELLDTRADASQLPPQRDARPAHFFLCAAQAAVQRRRWAARAAEARGGRPPAPVSPAPVPGPYVGQVAVRDPPRRLSDEEFVEHLEAQEAALDHASLALEVLAQAQEHCSRAAGGRGSRQTYYIGLLIAREHLASGDAGTAHRLLLLVAGIYRREQWRLPLSAALLELLECATRLSLKQEHILHSLELSALDGSMAPPQRAALAAAALASLTAGGSGEEGTQGAIELAVKPVNHPLLSCFQLSAGFAEPDAAAEQQQPPGGLRFGVALRSLLPVDVPVSGVEASFAAAGGGETAVALEGGGGCLRPGEWARWRGEVAAPLGAVLAARDVVLRVSDCASVRWHLPAFPGFPLLGGSGGEADAALLARAGLAFAPGLHEAQAPPDFQPVELRLEGESFGLVGETGLVRLALRAPCAVSGASLRLQAGYLEGGSHPQLSLTDAHGVRHEGREAGPDAMDGVPTPAACVLERVPLGRLEAGVVQQLEVAVTFQRSGQLLLSASLAHDAPQAGAVPGTASAALEVTVEEPFGLSAQLLTLPLTSALLLPEAPDGAAAQLDEAGEPQPEALPSEEVCLLRASLRVSAPTEVEVASVSVRGPDGVEWLDAAAAGVGPDCPAALGKADILGCVLRFRSAAAGSRASLGQLLVSWKRRRKGSVAPGCVETAVPLPGARFVAAPLTARLSLPGTAVAGQPLRLSLALRNRTPLLQRFTVAVGDASGFVLAGSRSAAGSVLPHGSAEHALTLVGYSPGLLALPQVRLTALRYGAVVEPLAGHRLLVCPAAVGQASTPAPGSQSVCAPGS